MPGNWPTAAPPGEGALCPATTGIGSLGHSFPRGRPTLERFCQQPVGCFYKAITLCHPLGSPNAILGNDKPAAAVLAHDSTVEVLASNLDRPATDRALFDNMGSVSDHDSVSSWAETLMRTGDGRSER